VVPPSCLAPAVRGRQGRAAANHQQRLAHADQAQRALTGIADYREDFYYREAFSLA
jgi:hypothetical protein